MYVGFLSAGTMCAERVLAVPSSRLADDLRQVIGDWQGRVPVTPQEDNDVSARDASDSGAS